MSGIEEKNLVMMTPTEEQLYKSYNQLKILQNNYSAVYGWVPLIMESVAIVMIVLNLFLAITIRNFTGLFLGLIASYLINVYFSRLAQVHSSSSETIQSWKQSRGSGRIGGNVFGKFIRSVRPLHVRVGKFFFIDKPFILTFFSIIVEQTVNLIISYS